MFSHFHLFHPESEWSAVVNGFALQRVAGGGPLYPNPYPEGIAPMGEFVDWDVPTGVLKPGMNRIRFHHLSGPTVGLHYFEMGAR